MPNVPGGFVQQEWPTDGMNQHDEPMINTLGHFERHATTLCKTLYTQRINLKDIGTVQ